MTPRPIIDAGPGLNFFSLNKERLLFNTLGPLSTPETVRDEILRKSTQDQRFSAASTVLKKLPQTLFEILPDDMTEELEPAVSRLGKIPARKRMRDSKDLGELMVIAHAAISAESGHSMFVLIDDGDGRSLASSEAQRLNRLRNTGASVGTLSIVGTTTILERAAGTEFIPNRDEMRKLY